MRQTFRAFRSRNFRWYMSGQLLSMVGMWMQQIAVGWIAYELTGSALMLGILGAIGLVPSFFISPFAGVLCDRYDRRKILVLTNMLSAAQALTLTALVITGTAQIEWLLVLSFVQGISSGFDWPTRQSLVVHLIEEREDMANAIALNSTCFNLARLLGPSVGGLLVGIGRSDACLLLNAISSLIAIYTILKINLQFTNPFPNGGPPKMLAELKEGFQYTARHRELRSGIMLVACASMFIMPYAAILPIVASEVLRGGSKLYGWLSAAPALGAVAGGLYLAGRVKTTNLFRLIRISGLTCASGMFAFAFSRNTILSSIALVILGASLISHMSTINTMMQTLVDENKRGRVMSFFTMGFMGAIPIGNILFGASTELFGSTTTLASAAVCSVTIMTLLTHKLNTAIA